MSDFAMDFRHRGLAPAGTGGTTGGVSGSGRPEKPAVPCNLQGFCNVEIRGHHATWTSLA